MPVGFLALVGALPCGRPEPRCPVPAAVRTHARAGALPREIDLGPARLTLGQPPDTLALRLAPAHGRAYRVTNHRLHDADGVFATLGPDGRVEAVELTWPASRPFDTSLAACAALFGPPAIAAADGLETNAESHWWEADSTHLAVDRVLHFASRRVVVSTWLRAAPR